MSPRRLGGWEPSTYTKYFYDETGRLVGSVETRDPEFDCEQVDLLLALEALSQDIGQHGQLLSESTSGKADPNNYDGGYRFAARGPFTDWAEKAKQDAIAAYREAAGESANLNGMFWNVEKVEDTVPG